jgi:hypothetical protein
LPLSEFINKNKHSSALLLVNLLIKKPHAHRLEANYHGIKAMANPEREF